MIDSDEIARMYGQIVGGVTKDQSTLANSDEEHSQWWDQCAAEVAQMREDDPNVIFDVVGEVPSVADVPDQPDSPADAADQPADQSGQPDEPDQPADQPGQPEEPDPAGEGQ